MPTVIGITVDNQNNTAQSGRYELSLNYSRAVVAAGATPILLPHHIDQISDYLNLCHGFIFTGGVDPRTESFGQTTHLHAQPMDPGRQAFELALLAALDIQPHTPVLGVCLGMQLMALHHGGKLHQHLPDILGHDAASLHLNNNRHSLIPSRLQRNGPQIISQEIISQAIITAETIVSHHHQSVADPGKSMRIIATAPDGVIECIDHPDHPFYLGVQWHPERTGNGPLGLGIIEKLVAHCGAN